MNKTDIIRKLTSRKLWMAVALFVSGLIVAMGGEKSTAETVSGCIMQGAAVLSYLFAEGWADASNAAQALPGIALPDIAVPAAATLEIADGVDVDTLTDDQLRAVLQQIGFTYTDKMTREEMLAALDEAAEQANT